MAPRALTLATVGLALLVAALWTAGEAWSARRLPVAPPILVTTAYSERADTLRRNETLSDLFARHNITGQQLVNVLDAAEGINPRRVQANQVLTFRYLINASQPDRVTIRLGDERIVTLLRDSGIVWHGESEEILWSVEVRRAIGTIQSSLYVSIDGLIPDSVLPASQRPLLIWDLADGVFGWVIDFTRDNYEGDSVRVLFERLTSPQGDVRYGRILAAKVQTRGVENTAYVMTDESGRNAYYDANATSLRRTFKRYPVSSFKYISSGFSRRRFHPVLRRNRPHLGVDYRAITGRRIVATGDGVVKRAGRWGGYGIMVAIRHPKDIETRYAHMSRLARGIRPNVPVKQGQVIGYVGMSGLATAPHVHYEFLKNGRHTDPRTLRFGGGTPVPKNRRAEFESLRAYYSVLLAAPPGSAVAAGID